MQPASSLSGTSQYPRCSGVCFVPKLRKISSSHHIELSRNRTPGPGVAVNVSVTNANKRAVMRGHVNLKSQMIEVLFDVNVSAISINNFNPLWVVLRFCHMDVSLRAARILNEDFISKHGHLECAIATQVMATGAPDYFSKRAPGERRPEGIELIDEVSQFATVVAKVAVMSNN